MFFDFLFTYKYTLRFIILSKFSIDSFINSYQIPFLNKLIFFFPLSKLEDKDHVSFYNYCYLFYFFFGKCANFSKYKSNFHYNIWYYSFTISIKLLNKEIYSSLFFYLNDILSIIEPKYIMSGIFSKRLNIFYLVLKDLNLFSEKKTNLGLFFLNHSLSFHLCIKGGNVFFSKILLKNLKIKYIF